MIDDLDDFIQRLEGLRQQAKIFKASLKDDLCNYDYEITQGPCSGDKLNRKGSSSVHDDLINALNKLRPHLAILDDYFEDPGTLQECDQEASEKFYVSGFKVSGTEDSEGFHIYGTKHVSHGVINLESPKISLSSGYQYFFELQDAIKSCQDEVLQYMNGKAAPVAVQTALEFEDNGEFDNPID